MLRYCRLCFFLITLIHSGILKFLKKGKRHYKPYKGLSVTSLFGLKELLVQGALIPVNLHGN